MRPQLILIFGSCLIISCKKEVPQGISPKAYFPAFPGSSWTYVDDFGAMITYSTGPEYVVDEFEREGEHYMGKVPVYDGKYVWGYAFRGGFTSVPSLFMNDEDPAGSTIRWSHYVQIGTSYRTFILAKDTSIIVAGVAYSPTIVIEDRISSPIIIPQERNYYTKDIGLVKIEKFDTWGVVDTTLSLVSYFINR